MAGASDRTRTTYDRWAASYDQYPNWTVAVDELPFPVLEIGCGTGRDGLADGDFDAVVASLVLEHIEDTA